MSDRPLTQRELLDLFDRCEAHPGIRAAIREVLQPTPPAPTEDVCPHCGGQTLSPLDGLDALVMAHSHVGIGGWRVERDPVLDWIGRQRAALATPPAPTEEDAMNDRHVSPINEDTSDVAHENSPTCWCQPVLDYEDPISGGRVYVHRRSIDGPAYEDAIAAQEGAS